MEDVWRQFECLTFQTAQSLVITACAVIGSGHGAAPDLMGGTSRPPMIRFRFATKLTCSRRVNRAMACGGSFRRISCRIMGWLGPRCHGGARRCVGDQMPIRIAGLGIGWSTSESKHRAFAIKSDIGCNPFTSPRFSYQRQTNRENCMNSR